MSLLFRGRYSAALRKLVIGAVLVVYGLFGHGLFLYAGIAIFAWGTYRAVRPIQRIPSSARDEALGR